MEKIQTLNNSSCGVTQSTRICTHKPVFSICGGVVGWGGGDLEDQG
jgi:hypothetical protein